MIDIRTIIISYITSNLVCTSLMASLWLQNRKRFAGIGFWLGHYVVACTTVLLLALRGILPNFISIVLANTLGIYGLVLLYIGVRRFFGQAGSQIHNYLLLAVFMLVHAWFTYPHPSLLARNINASVGALIVFFQIAWFIFRKIGADSSFNMRSLGVIFIFYCLICIARISMDLIIDPGNDFLKTGSDSLVFLAYQTLQITLTLNLFLQANGRLVVDLENDITERKRAEEAVRASEALYHQMFAHHSAVKLLIDPESGSIVEANLAAVNFYGYSADVLQGMNIQQINTLSPEEIAKLRQEIKEGTISYFSVPHRLASGEVREVEIYSVPIEVEKRTLLYSIIHDITERKQAEEALRATQRTVATFEERERMARELHDGIGQILGYVNVQAQATRTLLEKNQPEAAQKNLEGLVQVAQDAQTNLRQYILGLRDSVSPQRNLYQALQSYLNSFHQAWGIETIFSPPEGELPTLPVAVENQLLHIFQEALVNIRKHAEARRVEVLVATQAGELTLIISDNGRGFDPQLAPGAEKEHFGLSIMRERAEQVGGRMEIRSVIGGGTRVFVYVPTVSASASDENPKDMYSLRILLVDDQPLFLDGMRNLLTARGLTVIGTARDGLEACEQVKALRPDVVLMDVEMPNCDGIEATRRIKDEFPETKVVLLTVSEDDEHLLDAIKYGASSYLLKNLDAKQLFSTLDGLARGEIQIAPEIASRLLKEFNRAGTTLRTTDTDDMPPAELNMRQWEVLRLVARGLTYKEVGGELHVTEPAVKYHMGQILDRLQLKNREQAVAYLHQVKEARKKRP